MNKRKWIASVAVAGFLCAPLLAGATTITECQGDISTLRTATQAASYARGDLGQKLEQQLTFHLDKASNELNRADIKDALKQMGDYSFTLSRGIDSAKIDANDGANLQKEAQLVVNCISAIGTP